MLGKGKIKENNDKTQQPLLVVFDYPSHNESLNGESMSSEDHILVEKTLAKNGIDVENDVYFTYLFKIKPPNVSKIINHEYKMAVSILSEEISILRPRTVVAMGRYSITCIVAAHLEINILDDYKSWYAYETNEEKQYFSGRSIDKNIKKTRTDFTKGTRSSLETPSEKKSISFQKRICNH